MCIRDSGGCAYSGGILLDAELRGAEKKLVAAHEIAHILFGHCNHPSPYQEEEARIFAAVVVAMEPVSYTHLDVYKRQIQRARSDPSRPHTPGRPEPGPLCYLLSVYLNCTGHI